MKYQGSPGFSHGQADKIGVLVTNLGTPEAPTKKALKPYLKEFLSDPRVVEVPRLLWFLILNGVILRFRPKRSAEAYKTVWTDRGSPLLFHTQDQASAIEAKLKQTWGDNIVVDFAMRYGNPALSEVVEKMMQKGVRKLLVLPLYPQYSASTTASTFDALAKDFTKRRWLPELRFITHYHDFSPFIEAAAQRIEKHWDAHGRADKLLFSYHGIPLRYLKNGDPYHCECYKTSRLLAERLGLGKDEYLTTFQSRFGREEWLQPYTDMTMKALPGKGVKSVQVFCPGFSSDCLETVEEIGEENREYFMESGGERYEYISALNAESGHIDALSQLIENNLQGWSVEDVTEQRQQRADQVKKQSLPYDD
ncbi:ferrochelatase [Idiomarina loihiensis]|jgi:ferrochelatase|uniref:Ferrochelatase n=1 Tax=Idiomarina loihiensis (strain ATCC BAA-735 / DSM 15497 / L2-TR) TaxID=283942 RepID=HEMH_IDILO|nr:MULTISPECIES: ferrochelatase [Idiomarina]Q5QVZ8.1 RecName: Full=Ferrochelatase; AltName: Full=Heme synthase; AltName: Full=Protoheme ferro-lyase [Idiomarina loihiensis L2TR]NWO03716.1 ferrochelatase [Idiomarinaceae bacterium]AAV83179.1 Protoheme ferro-lyase [Idiomarina loihiensis L2TR]AGM37222.1 ferrochelatase [Idiomarina loihiensis GSL 199]MAA62979.1 ferrochelatase [Idiomarina sp.]MBL4856895.1 ferrochelatase [Idiomarina sp.]|tara:strand:- start:49797 stop:50891 length:1095 start_codon:yes stop_codon:yes gene_type:complete